MTKTHYVLHPNEQVRSPRILLVLWEGQRLHGHNMLRQVLYKHYLHPVKGEPHQKPLASVNTCFTYHGNGGYLTQATEKTLVPLIEPFVKLGAEAYVIDAGWYQRGQLDAMEELRDRTGTLSEGLPLHLGTAGESGDPVRAVVRLRVDGAFLRP